MPGPKRGFTTPHTCATVDASARNQPSERDGKAREKLQEKTFKLLLMVMFFLAWD